MEPALEVEDLSVAFGAFSVFKELTFSVPRGSSLAVIGPNGSGKTVLFKALIGSIPFVGRVRWAAGTRIGYVPQKTDIDRDLPITGRDVLVAKKTVTRAADDIGSTLQLVGLEGGISAKPIGVLSGGQFQRLLLAVALVGSPNVLLLDEPTASVDEPGQEKLNELVRRVQRERGLTVLLISHDLSVVYQYASNVLCLGHQRTCFGPPRTILTPELLEEVYGSPMQFHLHDV